MSNPALKSLVAYLFLELQWSPEQIANRLIHEKSHFKISYATIYRAIYAGVFNVEQNHRAIKNLRHRGKPRRSKGKIETRGKIAISNRIEQRPKEANERASIGHWEADTVAGKTGSACLVTITDRCSRYLLAGKISKKYSVLVADKMIALLSALPKRKRKTMTPDRGKEFATHSIVTDSLDMPFYFADPYSPWQRGTNENTNGLIREYLPKFFDIALCSEEKIEQFIRKINHRPRKCLDWKTPHEVFFNKVLHLI